MGGAPGAVTVPLDVVSEGSLNRSCSGMKHGPRTDVSFVVSYRVFVGTFRRRGSRRVGEGLFSSCHASCGP